MRKLLAAVLATALAAVLAATAVAATKTVKVGDNYFVRDGSAPTVTVSKGTRVTFKWVGDQLHNVRVTKGPRRFKSPNKTTGTYSRTMTRVGRYRLICDFHRSDMRMTLRVR